MNRRDFMRILGVSGAFAGVSTSHLARLLAAAPAQGAPKRLIVISHCHGWPYDAWKMRPDGFDTSIPGSFSLKNMALEDFSIPLAPLYTHRHLMLPVDGLSLATAELDMDGNRHDTGWIHSWTGNWVDFGSADTGATSASLDQRVAAHIAVRRSITLLTLMRTSGGQLQKNFPAWDKAPPPVPTAAWRPCKRRAWSTSAFARWTRATAVTTMGRRGRTT